MENQKIKKYKSNVQFGWNKNLFEPVEDDLDIQKNEIISIKKDSLYSTVRSILLPYTQLKSRFYFHDALKLAEMDMQYKLCPRSPVTPYVPSLLGYSSPIRVNTIDINGGPGGFVEYIQFRYVNGMTVGITPRISASDNGWDLKHLDPHRLQRLQGGDYSGDILTQWKWFLKYIQSHFAGGLDFVSGNGWDESDRKMDWIAFLEFYLMIQTIQDGANGVIRMKQTWSKLMLDTVYLSTLMFEDVYLFQPLVSGSDSDEIYLVLIQALSERKDYLPMINEIMEKIPSNVNEIESILSSNLPEKFMSQMEEIRMQWMTKQIETLKRIRDYLRIYKEPLLLNVSINQKLAEWALPDPYE
jgi:hypothetical protein